jgi:rhamnose transport system ATP-binding protein
VNSNQPLLKAQGISKRFGAIAALRGVDLDVDGGSVHALLGHNGAGKSTLMNILSGVYTPDSGNLFLSGEKISFSSPREALDRGITMVHQELSIVPDLDIGENIFLGREPLGALNLIDWQKLYLRTDKLLAELKLDFSARTPCSALNVGSRQMVEIARAISRESKILILDEPTSALTTREQRRLFEFIRHLKGRGIGILYVTHRLGEIRELADVITILRDGQRVTTVPTHHLDHSSLIQMMVGHAVSASTAPAPPQGAAGLDVIGLTSKQAGLRDISLSVSQGEIVGIAGMLGSGRTEIFETLFGIRPFESGLIRVHGQEVALRSPLDSMAAGLALVPEDRRTQGIFPGVPIWKNAVFASVHDLFRGALGFVRESSARRAVQQAVRGFNIRARSVNDEIQYLSGGNQQKVILARWLMRQPRILLLDDPTAGIDIGAKAEIHSLIRTMAQEGISVVMASSEFPELIEISHRILVLRAGQIIQEVDPASATEALLVALTTETKLAGIPESKKSEEITAAAAKLAPPHGPRKAAIHQPVTPPSARYQFGDEGWRILFLAGAMASIVLLFGSLNNYYFRWAHFLDMGRQASLLVVTSIGATLVILAGEIDLSPGAIVGLTSVAIPQLLDLSIPMIVVLLLGLGLGALVGAVNGIITLRLAVPSFLTTLGTMAIARGIALYVSDQPRQVSDETFAALFNSSVLGIPQVVLYSFGLAAVAAIFWKYSRFGLQVRAIGSNPQGARFSGVATRRLKFWVFVAAGVFSAAGALMLLGRTLTGLSGGADGLELNAIAAVILGGGRLGGGKASMIGTFLGALLLTMVFSGIAGMGLTAAWQLLTKGMILVAVIIFMRK